MLQHKIDVFFLFESLSDKHNGKINKLVALVSVVRPTGEHNFKGYPWDTYISRFDHFSDTINRVFPSTCQVSFQEQKKFPPTYLIVIGTNNSLRNDGTQNVSSDQKSQLIVVSVHFTVDVGRSFPLTPPS